METTTGLQAKHSQALQTCWALAGHLCACHDVEDLPLDILLASNSLHGLLGDFRLVLAGAWPGRDLTRPERPHVSCLVVILILRCGAGL